MAFFERGRKLALPLLFLSLTSLFLFAALQEVSPGLELRIEPLYYSLEIFCIAAGFMTAWLSLQRHKNFGTFPSLFRSLGIACFSLFVLLALFFPPDSSETLFVYLNGAVTAGAFIALGAWTKRKPATRPNFQVVFACFLFVLLLSVFFFIVAFSGRAPLMRIGASVTAPAKDYALIFCVLIGFAGVGFVIRFLEESEEIAFWTTLGLFSFAVAGLFFAFSTPFSAFWWVQEFFKVLGLLSLLIGSIFLSHQPSASH